MKNIQNKIAMTKKIIIHILASKAVVLVIITVISQTVRAQIFPPGHFFIDGIALRCGNTTAVITTQIPDVAMADMHGQIYLNPIAMAQLPTVLKLYVYAHECGHYVVGGNEMAADCWAIRTGRDEGWFPPQAFNYLIMLFQNNPGSLRHPAGPARIQNMMACYQQ